MRVKKSDTTFIACLNGTKMRTLCWAAGRLRRAHAVMALGLVQRAGAGVTLLLFDILECFFMKSIRQMAYLTNSTIDAKVRQTGYVGAEAPTY